MAITLIKLPVSGEAGAEAIGKRQGTCRAFGPNYDLKHVWRYGRHAVELWAKDRGRAGNENKSELPPPVDSALYYGPIYLVKAEPRTTTPVDFTLDDWKNFYSLKFGGFEDLDADESPSEDELDGIDESLLTKDGYMKDGFVVDSSDLDEEASDRSPSEAEASSSDGDSSGGGDSSSCAETPCDIGN